MDSAPALADLDAVRSAFVDAVQRHETATIAGLYSAGARLLAPNADVVLGRDAVAAFWGAGIETGVTAVELAPDDVELHATHALEVGRYALRVETEPGFELVDRGRYLLVYRFDDGHWERAAEMFAPDLPAPVMTGRTP